MTMQFLVSLRYQIDILPALFCYQMRNGTCIRVSASHGVAAIMVALILTDSRWVLRIFTSVASLSSPWLLVS